MIDPSDGDILGWSPDDMAYKADASDTYRFLISLPLYAKRDIFRSMYGVLSKCSLLDVFRQPKQVKWATGIIKLGMQLPLEDISLATQAFSLYTDALFAISSLYNKGDDGNGDGDGDGDGLFHSNQNDDTINEDLLDILLKPCILFNPRVFFANELPSRVVTDRTRKTTIETHESCFAPMQHNINKGPWSPHDEPMQIRGNRSTDSLDGTSDALSASSGAVDRQGVEAGDDQVAMRQHVEQASVALFSKKSLDESPHVLPGSTSQGANSISHAVKLWDKYVELLQKVLQVYSTLVRGLKSLVSSKTLVNAFDSLMVVVDMLLSQGGKNPRLKPWAEKYRLVIGPELWNKTWGTMGDRLEEFVVKLVFDIWARGMALSVKVRDSLTDKMGYWLHRESFMAAWLQVINQVSLKVLQHHYPYDDIVATDRIHLQFGDFSMSGKMSPESAIVVLERYARTRIDFDAISDHSYGIYAKQICTIVRRALNIKRLVYIKGTPFAQLPPTANYVLHYFRYPLLEVSLRKFVPSRETANVRRDVFSLVCMLLIMPSNAADPISDANRNDLIHIKLPNKQNKGKDQKTHALSNSLYKALSTQVYVLSTLLLRRMDNEQRYSSLTPIDMVLARMALYQNMVPNTNLLLRGCSPAIAEMLEGYIPVSVEFFSAYKRAIYSKINLKRFQDGKWSDVATLTTARYPSGSKQWVSFPSMPTNATAKPISNDSHTEGQADTKVDLVMDNAAADTADRGRQVAKDISLPWVRMSSEILYCSKLRTGFCVNDQKLACTKPIRPLIDTENESRIEEVIAEDFLLQHSVRNEPEIESTPTHPSEQRPRGNCFSRVNMQFFGVDVTAIDISAEMLATIDTMDELTRPFSAQPVVIYLHSPKSLSTDRRYAKGPLLGVSPEFKQFLESIGQSHTTPLTRLKRHPDDPTILRYTFGIDSYEIGYNLAPNVSSLLSNVPMGSRNNKVFYESVRERGIAIVWFDRHPGNLDSALTWDFLDSCEEDTNADEDYSRGASKTNLFSHRGMAENGKEQGSASTSHGLFKSRSAQSDAAATYLQGSSSQHSNRSSKSGHLKDSPHFHRSRARELFEKAVHFKHKKSPGVFERDSALRTTSEPRESGREVNGLLGAHTDSKLDHHEQQPLSMRGGSIEISDTDNMSFASDATDTSEQHHPVSQKARHEHLDHAEGDGKRDTSEPAKSTGGERTAPKIRVVIAIAPIENTNGKLVKATISATGGSEEMNNRFVQMTGPLTSSTVINIDDIALLLSATVIDAAANIASLSCDDFTAVTKRMEMIKYVITNYSSTPRSITDLHKFVFPAGTSGTANAFKIPQSVKRMSTGKKGMETSIV
ncbi:hypothetical protein LPJ81_001833 [Coemansia sp. IMI 209127]|nr:hypothetical protein LPJ81_001833 [Coemansia sp. IMI 209127]